MSSAAFFNRANAPDEVATGDEHPCHLQQHLAVIGVDALGLAILLLGSGLVAGLAK